MYIQLRRHPKVGAGEAFVISACEHAPLITLLQTPPLATALVTCVKEFLKGSKPLPAPLTSTAANPQTHLQNLPHRYPGRPHRSPLPLGFPAPLQDLFKGALHGSTARHPPPPTPSPLTKGLQRSSAIKSGSASGPWMQWLN